jgi:hypothetical protein
MALDLPPANYSDDSNKDIGDLTVCKVRVIIKHDLYRVLHHQYV